MDDVFAKLEATLKKQDPATGRNLDRKLFDVNEAPHIYEGRLEHVDAILLASLQHAREFLRAFFAWYNTEHHHSGLALLTPHDVHHSHVDERISQRARVLDAAYAAHPERFVRCPPVPRRPPATVWINPPKDPATEETRA